MKSAPGILGRAIEEIEAPSPLRSVAEETCRVPRDSFGELRHLVEDMGLTVEEGGLSFVGESAESLLPVVEAEDGALKAPREETKGDWRDHRGFESADKG